MIIMVIILMTLLTLTLMLDDEIQESDDNHFYDGDINAGGILAIHIYFDLVSKTFKRKDHTLGILNINIQIFV